MSEMATTAATPWRVCRALLQIAGAEVAHPIDETL
jgi:hypothetical protein